jgi:hypothetical protein
MEILTKLLEVHAILPLKAADPSSQNTNLSQDIFPDKLSDGFFFVVEDFFSDQRLNRRANGCTHMLCHLPILFPLSLSPFPWNLFSPIGSYFVGWVEPCETQQEGIK